MHTVKADKKVKARKELILGGKNIIITSPFCLIKKKLFKLILQTMI